MERRPGVPISSATRMNEYWDSSSKKTRREAGSRNPRRSPTVRAHGNGAHAATSTASRTPLQRYGSRLDPPYASAIASSTADTDSSTAVVPILAIRK